MMSSVKRSQNIKQPPVGLRLENSEGDGGDGGRPRQSHLGLAGDQEIPGGNQQSPGGELSVLPVEAAEGGQPALPGSLPPTQGDLQGPGQVAGEHPGSSPRAAT